MHTEYCEPMENVLCFTAMWYVNPDWGLGGDLWRTKRREQGECDTNLKWDGIDFKESIQRIQRIQQP